MLHGPLKSCKVKSTVTRAPKQTWCFFSVGWAAFCKQNEFEQGDTLVFTQSEAFGFEVRKT